MDFTFYMPARVISGPGAVRMTPDEINRYSKRWEELHNFDNVSGDDAPERGK